MNDRSNMPNHNGAPYWQPSYTPYYQPYVPPVLTPQQEEKKRLRGDANYIGGMMLALTAAMQLTFTVVLLVLTLFGVVAPQDYSDEYLGLGNTKYLLLYAGVYIFSFLVPAVLVAVCCKRRHFPLSPAKPVAAGDAFFGVLAAMGMCIAANYVTNYIIVFFEQFGISTPDMPEMMVHTPESLLLNLLVIAVLPALLEEMVFRGYVLRALRAYGDWFAVLVSALLFGLMHGNLLQIPFALMVGIVLGWLYVMTDNIWLPIAVHFCNNAMSILLDYFSCNLAEDVQGIYFTVVFLAIGLIGAVSLTVLLVRRSDLFRRLSASTLLRKSERIGTVFSSPLFILSVVVFVILTVVGTV